MSEKVSQNCGEEFQNESGKDKPVENNSIPSDSMTRQKLETETTLQAAEAPVIENLTPEEQMALYEKELKENDWGHQPC